LRRNLKGRDTPLAAPRCGCFSNGKTIKEAKRNIREAIQQHIAPLLAHGEAIPQNEKLAHVEELTVGVS